MVLDWAFVLPFLSSFMRRSAAFPASPYNATRLLEQDELVMVFPEGVKGTGKPFSERYRLQRFGRGGFVEIALRTGAPIVPVAVVGSEEIYPKLADSPTLARAIGAPFVPITPTFPWLGPLGLIPLPSRWRIEFCEPIDLSEHPPEAAEDRAPRLRPLRAGPRDDPGEALREPGQAGLRLPLAGSLRRSAKRECRGRPLSRPLMSTRRAHGGRVGVPGGARAGARRGRRRRADRARDLRAASLRMRFEFTDLGLELNVAATDDDQTHRAGASASVGLGAEADPDDGLGGRQPLSAGRESLAIAIARGQVARPRRVADRAALPAGRAADRRAVPRVSFEDGYPRAGVTPRANSH